MDLSDNNLFYYFFDSKVILKENKSLLFVSFIDSETRAKFISNLMENPSLKVWNSENNPNTLDDNLMHALVLESNQGKEIPDDLILAINERPDVDYVTPVIDYQDNEAFLTNQFSVKLKPNQDYNKLEILAKDNYCELILSDYAPKGVYYVKCLKESGFNAIQMSVAFYETGIFEYCSPHILYPNVSFSTDPLFSSQWGLENNGIYGGSGLDINIQNAWNSTQGDESVIVAVVDDGLDLDHPDLESNIVGGYDSYLQSAGGGYVHSTHKHGTKVAGVIGAIRDNGIGIAGIAPNCKIMPVNYHFYFPQSNTSYATFEAAARGIVWAYQHGADVINCSWGSLTASNADTITAINEATTQGRSGKGTVVVCASGNADDSNTPVAFPANMSSVISVGAISYDGYRVTPGSPENDTGWRSCYGPTLDIVAPGIMIPTTDIDENGNAIYTNIFGGTSAAAPHVAGVAALILSKYPELPEDLVRKAIQNGAISLPGYSSQSYNVYRHDEIGYGFLNASYALSEASILYNQYLLDHSPGLDFTIINSSSYDLSDVIIDVRGIINGQQKFLISNDILGGVASLEREGYPTYRGYNIDETPGTSITNITLELFASCYDYEGEFEVGVAYDVEAPSQYQDFAFGYGNLFVCTLPDIVVPNNSRRMIYIRIFDIY